MDTENFLDSVISKYQKHDSEVLVQISQCSLAVGAERIFNTLKERLPNSISVDYSGCDGACFAAPKIHYEKDLGHYTGDIPVINSADSNVRDYLNSQTRIVLENAGAISASGIDGYLDSMGFSALGRVLEQSPEKIVDLIEDSGLKGRGGAYFPVSVKWRSAMSVNSQERHLVVNAEEGESITIFSPKYSVSKLANDLDTIPYEIMATLNRRIKRIYSKE